MAKLESAGCTVPGKMKNSLLTLPYSYAKYGICIGRHNTIPQKSTPTGDTGTLDAGWIGEVSDSNTSLTARISPRVHQTGLVVDFLKVPVEIRGTMDNGQFLRLRNAVQKRNHSSFGYVVLFYNIERGEVALWKEIH